MYKKKYLKPCIWNEITYEGNIVREVLRHSRIERLIVHKIKTSKMNLPTCKVFDNVCCMLEMEVLSNGMEDRN